jgi:hypothetical protein
MPSDHNIKICTQSEIFAAQMPQLVIRNFFFILSLLLENTIFLFENNFPSLQFRTIIRDAFEYKHTIIKGALELSITV